METRRKHSFGFEVQMRRPPTGHFRRWFEASSRLPMPGCFPARHDPQNR